MLPAVRVRKQLLHKRFRFCVLLMAALCAWISWGILPVEAEPEPQPSPSASGGEMQAEAIPVNQIGERIGRVSAAFHKIEEILEDSQAGDEVTGRMIELASKLDQFAAEHEKLLQTNTPSDIWFARTQYLADYRSQVGSLAAILQKRTEALKQLGDELSHSQEVWTLTKISVQNVKLNQEVADDINSVLESLSKYEEQVRLHQSKLLKLQNEVFSLNDKIDKLDVSLTAAIEDARSQVLQRNSDYLWVRLNEAVVKDVRQAWRGSLESQLHDLRVYLNKNYLTFFIYLIVFALVWRCLREVYRVVRPWANQSGELQYAVRLVEMPVPIAALAAEACFLSSEGASLYIVKAIAGFVAIAPALIVLRRIMDDCFSPLLNAVLLLLVISLFNQLAYETPAIARLLNLSEAVIISGFLAYYLRSEAFAGIAKINNARMMRLYSLIGYCALVLSVIAVLANIVGYMELANRIVSILLLSTVSVFILVAAAQFIVALLLFFLTVPPLSLLNLVQIHRAAILRAAKKLLYCIAFLLVVDYALGLAGYVGALRGVSRAVLDFRIAYGSVNVTIGQCLVAVLVLIVSYQLSKLFLAIAECDVLPRWQLKANAANVVLFFARYVPYIVCFLIACAVLGLSGENLAMVISALGVGIGFGLQNIINNFISGLILLFEPRISVGGVVEFGNYSGVLVNVGMRASVVRMFDGREVIVPNSELISNKVVSITNTAAVPYRCNISFALLGPVDIVRVREIVEKCALEHKDVMNTPAPLLILNDMETGYPQFVLRFWTRSYDLLVVTKNDLSFRIAARLQEEGWQLAGNKVELIRGGSVEALPIVNAQDTDLT